MDIIKKIKKYLTVGLLILVLVVTGCGFLEPPELHDYRDRGEDALLNDTEYQSFYQLFGDITENELRDLIQTILDNMHSAARYGDITKEDSRFVYNGIVTMRDALVNMEPDSMTQDNLIELLHLMSENRVGDLLTDFFSAMATDDVENLLKYADPQTEEEWREYDKGNMLLTNLLPMLEYIINMDFGNFEGIPFSTSGTTKDKSTDTEDIKKLTTALEHLVNPVGPYKDVYDQSKALFNIAKERENLKITDDKITVGQIKEIVNKFTGGTNLDNFDFKSIMDAVIELWEEENDILRKDSLDMLYALGRLMTDTTRPGHDGWTWTNEDGMTDMERVLLCMQDLLNPMVQGRDSIKNFLLNTLEGASLLEGADSIHGILAGLSTVNSDDMNGIDTALYKYLLQHNIEGESRGPATEINMSATRGVLYLLSSIYRISTIIEGPATEGLLSLITAENGTADYPDLPKENLIEWMLGLIVAGMYEYPESYDYIPGYTDPLEGLDWVFYEQDIKLINLNILKMDGLYGLLGILLEHDALFEATGYVVGGLTDPLPSLMEIVGSTGEKYSTGEKHKLFAILAPLLKHYWDQGRILDVVEMITYVNEINMATYKTLAWAGDNATFRQGTSLDNRLGHVLENIEGLYGYGLIYYGLRGDNEADDNHAGDPLDPILDLAIKILKKLQSTPYGDGSLLDYISASGAGSDEEVTDPAEFINNLFEPDDIGENTIDKLYDFLVENHYELTIVTKAIGNILLSLHHDLSDEGFENLFDLLINGEFLNTLQDELGKEEGQQALQLVARSVLEMLFKITEADLQDSVKTKDKELVDSIMDLLDAILKHSDTLIADIRSILPLLEKLFGNFQTTDTTNTAEGFNKILDTILDEIGKESTLTDKLKIMGYKTLWLKQDKYNKAGVITDETKIFEALDILLTGENPAYNLKPMADFLNAFLQKDMLLKFLAGETDKDNASSEDTQEQVVETMLSIGLIKVFFTSYDGRDSIVYSLFKAMHIHRVENGKIETLDVNLLIEDIADFITTFDIDPDDNSRLYNTLVDLLNHAADTLVLL